jgi:hypothetical protein
MDILDLLGMHLRGESKNFASDGRLKNGGLNGFNLFSKKTRIRLNAEYKLSNPGKPTGKISRSSTQLKLLWEDLSSQKRNEWNWRAARKKEKSKAVIPAPVLIQQNQMVSEESSVRESLVNKSKNSVDPMKKRGGTTGFTLFSKYTRIRLNAEYKLSNPEKSTARIIMSSTQLKLLWEDISSQERDEWNLKAAKEKEMVSKESVRESSVNKSKNSVDPPKRNETTGFILFSKPAWIALSSEEKNEWNQKAFEMNKTPTPTIDYSAFVDNEQTLNDDDVVTSCPAALVDEEKTLIKGAPNNTVLDLDFSDDPY